MGDVNVSAEQCEIPWYEAWSVVTGFAGATTGGLIGGFWPGAAAAAPSLAAFIAAGASAGFIIAYCSSRIAQAFLKSHDRTPTVTAVGMVIDVGRSPMIFPFDGDWLLNLKILGGNAFELMNERHDGAQACVRFKPDGTRYLHCEITSNIGIYGCIGAMAGAVAGGIAGAVGGAAAGAIIAAACLATGIFWLLCVIVAVLAAVIIAAVITAVVAWAGGAVGSGAGAIADEIEGQGDKADGVAENTCVTFTGRWVTDMDHGWNEIHDIEAIDIHDTAGQDGACLKMAAALGAGMVDPR
ncbi:MAG: hypothetical protein ACTSV1_08470 [Alphaproteobacteria bacterium]